MTFMNSMSLTLKSEVSNQIPKIAVSAFVYFYLFFDYDVYKLNSFAFDQKEKMMMIPLHSSLENVSNLFFFLKFFIENVGKLKTLFLILFMEFQKL